MPKNEPEQRFLDAEHFIQLQSANLKKELRLRDLVLSQLVYIVGLFWTGSAAKLGSAHLMYWIPAVLLFYVPSGIVVVHLSREMPLEGGLYQWAKLRMGDFIGFFVAVNLWATVVLIIASVVSEITANLAYSFGPSAAWITESKEAKLLAAALLMGTLIFVAIRGLAIAKWLHNSGGFVTLVILAGMVALAIPRWLLGGAATAPVAFTLPAVSLLNLNVLGKMGFGAFCGFDGVAIFSGEIRDPDVARSVGRSVWLAAPLIGLVYIMGTACVLTFTPPRDIDLVAPTTQVFSQGLQGTALALFAIPFIGVLSIAHNIGWASFSYNAAVRLPMVAGWDHLLPAWLSRLHPRFKTPTGSILCVGCIAFILTVLGNVGIGSQEAFQMLNNSGIMCWALTYLVMFAIPLVARGEKPTWAMRVAAVFGFSMTLLYVVLSIFPIVEVKNASSFTAKVCGLVIGINALGAFHFWRRMKQNANAV